MSNIFAMVTLKSSHIYTEYALKSFFKNTALDDQDEFLLIDNDGCQIDKLSYSKKIQIIKNQSPLSFAENVNQAMTKAIKNKKNLIFLNNDIIFTKNWFEPLKINSDNISIPLNNQIFSYQSDCGNLKLQPTMTLKDFGENYILLNDIIEKHKKKFTPNQKFQGLLMPFFCFKIPYKIMNDVGYFDKIFVCGAEDVDYRIRCAIKGYDVNFLSDSYLLHFHGKSTWDGGETSSQTELRNQLYTEAFIKKWGEGMTKIFIYRKDFTSFLKDRGLDDIYKQGKFKELIKKLLG